MYPSVIRYPLGGGCIILWPCSVFLGACLASQKGVKSPDLRGNINDASLGELMNEKQVACKYRGEAKTSNRTQNNDWHAGSIIIRRSSSLRTECTPVV